MRPIIRIGAALALLATQPWCWCGADGLPMPPKPEAKPPVEQVAPAAAEPTLEAEAAPEAEDAPAAAPTQDSDG